MVASRGQTTCVKPTRALGIASEGDRKRHQRKQLTFCALFSHSEAQRKYEDNCDSLHEESVSETAENSGEEAGEGALDMEAGEMTDGGEDDYDEEGSHHLVRETVDRADREGECEALWEISSGQTVFAF